ncbi:MAG TPA: thioredoxin family protein [Massilibacterium sp.]|nr:thioredoxin family protein [Massilibacterium sp.]
MELHTYEEVQEFIDKKGFKMLYISRDACSVCHALLPKVEAMLKEFPKVEMGTLLIEKAEQLAGELSIFTVPAILIYIDDKEMFRYARFVSMDELRQKISKYYELYY